jgi:tetratricopeptide (TPR) repeat protein
MDSIDCAKLVGENQSDIMNSPKKPKSLQDIIKRRQKLEFVGREDQLKVFRENIHLSIDDDRRRFIFNIWGQGGIGKTSLLSECRKIAEEKSFFIAYVDEDAKDVPSTMGMIAEQFERQGHPLKAFSERYRVYRQKRQELETDPEAPNGFSAFAGRTMARGVLQLVDYVPVANVITSSIDKDTKDALVGQAGDFASYVARKVTNKDEVRLVLDPLEVLTPLFLRDVKEIAGKHSIALFFDTYERTGDFLDAWLRNNLEGRYGELPANIVILIAGRHELVRNEWSQYDGLVAHLPLEPFTENEAQEYLTRKGVTNKKVVDMILHLSGKLPLLVATLAIGNPTDLSAINDPSDTAIDRFLKWVDDPNKRQTALNAAIPRRLNRDVLATLLGGENIDDLFNWLIEMPFVQEKTEGWEYHDVVRIQMLRYKRRESEQDWNKFHETLANYYEALQKEIKLNEESIQLNPTWQKYELEKIYHRLCQSSHRKLLNALTGFLNALNIQHGFACLWATTIGQVGRDSNSLEMERWSESLVNGLKNYDEKLYEEAAEVFTKLLEYEGFEDKHRAIALGKRANAYYLSNQNSRALIDFSGAIQLSPDTSEYWSSRGLVYGWIGQHNEALADCNKAIELDQNNHWAYAQKGRSLISLEQYEEAIDSLNDAVKTGIKCCACIAQRGETHYRMQHYEEALSDFNHATELDPNYHWAYERRGLVMIALDRYEDAISSLTQAAKTNQDCSSCLIYRADVYFSMQNYENALSDVAHAIELEPEHVGAFVRRGQIYGELERYEEALADFNRAIELTSECARAFVGRGQIYSELERYEEALADFDRAIELEPENLVFVFQRGFIEIQNDDIFGAHEDFGQVSKQAPKFVDQLQNLNLSKTRKISRSKFGQLKKILYGIGVPTNNTNIESLSRNTLDFFQENSELLIAYFQAQPLILKALNYKKMRHYKEALLAIKRAIHILGKFASDTSDLNLFQALLLSNLGHYADAIKIYENFLKEESDNFYILYSLAVCMVKYRGLDNARMQVRLAHDALRSAVQTGEHALSLYGLGGLSALLNNADQAFQYLQQALSLERELTELARHDLAWSGLINDSRFQLLVFKKINANTLEGKFLGFKPRTD